MYDEDIIYTMLVYTCVVIIYILLCIGITKNLLISPKLMFVCPTLGLIDVIFLIT